MLDLIEQLLIGNVLLYCIVGAILSLVVGALAIDKNGGVGIVLALPFAGAIIAPTVAFVVLMVTDTVFAFNLPSLILPMVVVVVVSLILCYGYSLDLSVLSEQSSEP